MSAHHIEQCPHGTVVGQCRCPHPSKTVRTVPCPPWCPHHPASQSGTTPLDATPD